MSGFSAKIKGLPCTIAVFLIRFYRAAISPLLPTTCRFEPTCSQYGLIAFQRFGFCKGFILTAKRIARCHPGGDYGYDPVPEVWDEKKSKRANYLTKG